MPAASSSSILTTSLAPPTVTSTSSSTSSSAFTQPSFNFDFSSMTNRGTAASAMTDVRNNWGTFFTEKPKATFSEELTNVVKGSSNELRGTQN